MHRRMFTGSSRPRITAITAGLAIMVTLAMLGVLSVASFTAIRSAEANQANILSGLLAEAGLDKLNEPFALPIGGINDVTGGSGGVFGTPSIQQTPDEPGANARYVIKFQTPNTLATGVDSIVFLLDDEFDVPATLNPNQISISADTVTGSNSPNQAVAPLTVTVDFVGTENDEAEITLTVGDMDTAAGTGDNGISAGANVTVIFQQAAGIKNPTEQGFDSWMVKTTQDTNYVNTTDEDSVLADASKGPFTPAIIELSSAGEPLGASVTLVGKGFEGGTTTTFWRDADADGVRDAGEIDLCSAITAGSDIATCTFTVSNPPFVPGTGFDCVGVFTNNTLTPGSISGCNYINAVDGQNRTSSTRNQADLDRQTFELEPSVPSVDILGKIKFTGVVQGLPAAGLIGQWRVQGLTVSVTNATRLKGQPQLDSFVEVAGSIDADGVVQAKKIKVKKVKREEHGEEPDGDEDHRSGRDRGDDGRRNNGSNRDD